MGLHDKIAGEVCGNEQARERCQIRETVDTISRGASAELPFEERAALYTLEILEQLTLAVCNMAETIDKVQR